MPEKVIRTYSIKELEKLSGIKAHTIRIWEKRYNLISPQRTSTNIRYYTGDDLVKLLNISSLINEGWKISHINEMTDRELMIQLDQLESTPTWDDKTERHIHRMISVSLDFDQVGFDAIAQRLIEKRGLVRSFTEVFFPVMYRIGSLWTKRQFAVTHEHFLSSNFKKLLFQAVAPQKTSHKKKALLFLPQWEEHELVLQLTHCMLSKKQVNPIYLGPKVPLESLLEAIEHTKPSILVMVAILKNFKKEISEYMSALSKIKSDLKIMIYYVPNDFPNHEVDQKNISVFHTLDEFIKAIDLV